MATLSIHNSAGVGAGAPTYADRASAGYSTKVVVGTAATAAIDVSACNVLRVYNQGDGSSEGTLFLVTGLAAVEAPTATDFYPIPAGQMGYIALDTGDTHIRFIGTNASMSVWYSQVG